MGETIAVRPDERFDVGAVEAYLRQRLEGFGDRRLTVEQFPSGHSNLTYLLREAPSTADAPGRGAHATARPAPPLWEGVLRRPPLGPVAPKAHDMEREFNVLSRVHPVFPLAPGPYVFCADPAVIGAPFYVMERRRGLVFDKEFPGGEPPGPDTCRRLSEALVDTLVDLHAVDYLAAGLGEIGRPEGYMQRQVRGWIDRYERAKTDEIDVVPAIARWMSEQVPPSPPPTIVHNDYKLNNVLLDPADPTRIVAVLDWEMTAVGDPLSDVGALLAYWVEPGDADFTGEIFRSVTATPGFMTRRELLERYASESGRDVSAIRFYLAFAYFKVAVICQQIHFRWKRGQTQDPRFAPLGLVAERLIQRAHRLAFDISEAV